MIITVIGKEKFCNVLGGFVNFLVDKPVDFYEVLFSLEYITKTTVRLQVHSPHTAMTARIMDYDGNITLVKLPGGETFDSGVITLPFPVKKRTYNPTQKCWPTILFEFFSHFVNQPI